MEILKNIIIPKLSNSAFVGIKKENGKYIFYLPKGYPEDKFNSDKLSSDEFDELKELFFDLYKIILKHTLTKARDGKSIENQNGVGGKDITNQAIFYDSLNIKSLIQSYDDTLIQSFNTKNVLSNEVHFDNFDFENAIYQNNQAIIIESQNPALTIQSTNHDIVDMYCFIYSDIKTQLKEEVSTYIKDRAHNFRNKYHIQNSFFDEDANLLEKFKDILQIIDKTSLHNRDYETFYNEIEKFLYFTPDENGCVMGIDNFHSIWEDMCFDYIFKSFKDDVLYADYKKEANLELDGYTRMYAKNKENYPFKMSFGGKDKYIYPDLITTLWNGGNINSNFNANGDFFIKEFPIETKKYIRIASKKDISNIESGISITLSDIEIDEGKKKLKDQIKEFENKTKTNLLCIIKNFHDGKFKDFQQKYALDTIKELQDSLKKIIDFKYKTKEEIDNKDKVKQKFYELALKNEKILENKFVLPKYSKDKNSEDKKLIIDEDKVDNLKIEYWNIRFLIKEYIK